MIWKQGVTTALITPFHEDRSVDLDSFCNLVQDQVRGQVSGLVLWGSTGEGPLLTQREKFVLLETARDVLRSVQTPPQLILNVGGSSTAEMVQLCTQLSPKDYDGMMVVVPPYVKPPIEGLIAHVQAVREFHKPVMLYHIPGRTGRRLSPQEMQLLLSTCPHITAVKESSGDLEMLAFLTQHALKSDTSPTRYVGDDPLYLEALQKNLAVGVVSVISNAIPGTWQSLSAQDTQTFQTLTEIFQTLCSVPNPVGIKHALFRLGLIESNMCRHPLVPYTACHAAHKQVSPEMVDAAIDRLRAYR